MGTTSNDEAARIRVLVEYDTRHGLYVDLAANVHKLLEQLLAQRGLVAHSITSRCKGRESLERKLKKPNRSYAALDDITDITAIRITTYFAEDVDAAAEVVASEFIVDESASIDKRAYDDPDRFGYQSLHYVVTISETRSQLAEWARFDGIRFEIQVRTILQHAWAEIEHDLGYKSPRSIPVHVRRRFSRVAGLLELADSEFSEIRRTLDAYSASVSHEIEVDPSAVSINSLSLTALVDSDSAVASIDSEVAKIHGATVDKTGDGYVSYLLAPIEFLGINSIEELEARAREHKELAVKISSYWLNDQNFGTGYAFSKGIGIYYLALAMLWSERDVEKIRGFFSSIVKEPASNNEMTEKLLAFVP